MNAPLVSHETDVATPQIGAGNPVVLVGGGPVGVRMAPEPTRWWKWLPSASGVAAHLALAILLLPRVPLPDTFIVVEIRTKLWFDNVWKQWSGYILLGLTVAAAAGVPRPLGLQLLRERG